MSQYTIKPLSEYQKQMLVFENSQDPYTLPDVRLLLRTDAHRYGVSWGKKDDPDYPLTSVYPEVFFDAGVALMKCGLKTVCAYIHGDEVSLLLDEAESNNARRKSRLISLVSSISALSFMNSMNKPATFFTKLSELPNNRRILDYFFWQRKTALRNLLSRNIGLLMERQNNEPPELAKTPAAMDEAEKIALLATLGRPLESFSSYEKYGAFLAWNNSSDTESSIAIVLDTNLPNTDESYLEYLSSRVFLPGHSCPESVDDIPVIHPSETQAKARKSRNANHINFRNSTKKPQGI